jgi:putative DNA primase/helicase
MPDDFAALFNASKAQLNPDPVVPDADWPFQCLGHDRGKFYLYTVEGRQVLVFNSRDLSSHGALLTLGSLRFFEGAFPGRESFNARAAADAIMRACYRVGVFNPDRLRGRGIWLDNGRRVMHLGDQLLVDGIATALTHHQSPFIYEQARPLAIELGAPLTDAEARRLLAMCEAASWAYPTRDGRLLAGWIVSALIGGALAWRPHLWILAEGGSGKSWVMENIIRPLLGPLAVVMQGKTTEAGIRGELGHDARPVVFDEAETQSDLDRARMQQAIDLARQASSEDGGAIVKGTKDGGSRRYTIRASFCFASINAGLTQAADESRFATLSMVHGNPDQFQALKQAHVEAMFPGVGGRLLARAIHMLPTIRANADLLADAIARTGAGRRAGDTLGTLIACQMSLVDATQLTPETAAAYLAAREWLREAAAEAKVAPEYERAAAHLMQSEGIRVTTGGRSEAMTISELIGICWDMAPDSPLGLRDADAALRRLGLRVMGDRLLIGNRAAGVAERFRNTPWGAGWFATLARIPGATRNIQCRFSAAYKDKCLALPLSYLMEGENGE